MRPQDTPENSIIDGENYRKTDSFGFREIVLKQVNRITDIYSAELTDGFWRYSQPNEFGHQEVIGYISDGRVSFVQSVECLHDLLLPKFDTQMKADAQEIEKMFKDAIEKQNTKESTLKLSSKVKISRKLFQKLCLFLERIGWLADGGLED